MTKHEVAVKTAGQEIAASRWDVTATGPDDSAAKPTIVFLHAGVCDRRSWYRTAEQLTDLGSLIAYDRRGFGESPVSMGDYRDLDDLWSVIDQASPSPAAAAQPVWLVGSSMGGLLAVDAALTSPERVAGLVLFAPAISGAPEDDDVQLDPGSEALFEQLGAARQAGDQEERLRLQARLWLDGPAAGEPRVQGPARELALAMNAIILANDFDDEAGAAGVDAWSKLEQVIPPVTVAWGDLDLPFLLDELEELVARLPRAERRVLPGTAHLPYLEQPDQVAAIVREAIA
jgi:pimeloyl-ACP methyl ester carboxylesterase